MPEAAACLQPGHSKTGQVQAHALSTLDWTGGLGLKGRTRPRLWVRGPAG